MYRSKPSFIRSVCWVGDELSGQKCTEVNPLSSILSGWAGNGLSEKCRVHYETYFHLFCRAGLGMNCLDNVQKQTQFHMFCLLSSGWTFSTVYVRKPTFACYVCCAGDELSVQCTVHKDTHFNLFRLLSWGMKNLYTLGVHKKTRFLLFYLLSWG